MSSPSTLAPIAPVRLEHPAGSEAAVAPRHVPGPILVADDGSAAATSALVVAKLIAASVADVQVVSVVEPTPVIMGPDSMPVFADEVDEASIRARRERLRPQVQGIFGEPLPTIDVVPGQPIQALARIARERRAGLVVTGLRHHGRLDRVMLHRETPLGVADAADAPVLVVPEGTMRLPRIALVAVAVDEASVHAARLARPLLARAEKVYVIHVRAPDDGPLSSDASRERASCLREMAQAACERVVAALDLPPETSVEQHAVTGHPVDVLLDFAEEARVELLVAGHHRRRLLDRLTGPRSVAERVFRGTRCAMLLVPDVPGTELPAGPHEDVEVFADPAAWELPLAAFTYRNAGRIAHLEIDAIAPAVRAQLDGCPFFAATYDTAAGVLHLAFGTKDERAPHLLHSIPDARALEVRRPREGEDFALRVAHDHGYSLLTFHE
jgi:nucleotide-binding universal stress UspA family protein